MKKRFLILVTIIALILASASSVFAGGLDVVSVNPKDGAKNSQPTNMAVKIKFSDTMVGASDIDANEGRFKITNPDGAEQPFQMVYSEKYPDELWLVLDGALEQKTEYKVTIGAGIVSANGNSTAESQAVTFTTRNTGTDSIISTVMMIFMLGLMFVLTSRAAKKKEQENQVLTVAQAEKLNPYKIAKAKGWKIEVAEEYVRREKEKAKKAEEKALEEKRRREAISAEERAKIEAEVDSEERRNGWFRVHAKGSMVAHGLACPKAIKKKNAAKRKAAEERAKKYAKNKKKK